jgi:hypothetical protein
MPYNVEWYDYWIINSKGCTTKWSRTNFKFYPKICPEEQNKTMKILNHESRVPSRIRSRHFPNINSKQLPLEAEEWNCSKQGTRELYTGSHVLSVSFSPNRSTPLQVNKLIKCYKKDGMSRTCNRNARYEEPVGLPRLFKRNAHV